MKKLRKAFVVGVMGITVLAMSVVVAPEVSAAASAGDLIKMDGLSSVYYLAADGKRYVFPNETTYLSWYSDFSSVVTIPQSELESYPLGANVTMRPGTNLVKITTDPKVYAVEPNGVLRWIPDEATALALYGADWASRVVDVADAFFTNYDTSGADLTATAYPTGSLVMFGEDSTVYYIADDGTARAISDEAAFLANRFQWSYVIKATIDMPTVGTPLTGSEEGLTDTSSGAGGTAGAGTGLTVSLASDTPDAGNIPAASPVDFLKFNLTASNDGDVNITTIKLSAYDLGSATNIDNVTLYDANGVKLGTSKNMNSDREATFNLSTPLNIPAGTTVVIRVRATIASGVTGGNYAIGLAAAANIGTNGAVVSGSFPIIGNSKAIVSGTSIGEVLMTDNPTVDASATADFGEDNVLLAGFSLAVSNEAILWESAMFKNAGTNNEDIVSNMRIEIDGDIVAEGASLAGKYVTFPLNNYLIAKNDTVSVEVYGDMGIASVGNTVNLIIDNASDFVFTGQDYGYGVLMDASDSSDTNADNVHDDIDQAGEGIKVTLAAGDFSIDVDKATTPAADVRSGDTNMVLATIKLTSNGENATIESIQDGGSDEFIISGTGLDCNEFDNVELRDVDNNVVYDVSVASSSTANACALTMNEEIAMVKGVTKTFELELDLGGPNDTYPIDANNTLRLTLEDGAFTITGDVSSASITDITPASVTGSIMTVKAASLTWTTIALNDKTVVPGASDVLVYKAALKAGASSYVTLSSVKIDAITGTSFKNDGISQLVLKLDGKTLKTLSNKITDGGTAAAEISFSSLPSGDRDIPAGETVYLEVYADFAASFVTTGDFTLAIEEPASSIIVKDKDNNTFDETVSNEDTISRTITLASTGTLKVELKTDDNRANDDTFILAGGTTAQDRYLAEIVFTTANEPVLVKTLVLGQDGDARDDDIYSVNLYDNDGTLVAGVGVDANGHADFDTLNIVMPADQATSYWVGVTTKTMNAEGDPEATADYGANIRFIFADATDMTQLGKSGDEAITAIGNDSGEDIDLTRDLGDATISVGEYSNATTTSATTTITGSILNSIVNDMSDGVLTAGAGKTIGKYKMVFDNGNNRTLSNEELKAQLVSLDLTISTSSQTTITDVQAYLESNSSDKTAVATPNSSGVVHIDFDGGFDGDNDLVDGTVTIVITATVGGTDGTGDYVQTEINDLLGSGDFTWSGNHGSNDTTETRLEITEVLGATLSN